MYMLQQCKAVFHTDSYVSYVIVLQLLIYIQFFVIPCTSGFPVHHQLLELAQIHVHQVGDAIQLSHPLSPLSPPSFSLSQHHSLFQ